MTHPAVTFVVMAGGRGERLWPLVGTASPKVCLAPTGAQTLLQTTLDRLRSIWPGAERRIVTTKEQAAAIRATLPASDRRVLLVEPEIKNTAAGITLAAALIARSNPNRVMVVVPADHWIGDTAAFQRAVRRAIYAAATHDTIATIGLRPTHPHTGLGYLCARPLLNRTARRPRVFRLVRFVEKPDHAEAQRLLKRPLTYWNSGLFVATADRLLEGVAEWLPGHAKRLVPLALALHRRRVRGDSAWFVRRAASSYRQLDAISFDHGVMSHMSEGIVVEGRFPWADLGSLDMWARLKHDASQTIGVGSRNITVVSQQPHLVATIGLHDLLVVHGPSATLICRPDQVQAVQELVKRMTKHGRYAAFQ